MLRLSIRTVCLKDEECRERVRGWLETDYQDGMFEGGGDSH